MSSKSLKGAVSGAGSQTEKARVDQVKNNAGGYVFETKPADWLLRFLILGTDGGTYYVTEQKSAMNSMAKVKALIEADEDAVSDLTVEVSVNGRAYKNSPAIFVAAMLLVHGKKKAQARSTALKVARTSTHLFELVSYLDALGGWGRNKRETVAAWYTGKTTDQLAYQVVKYRQRDGWTHRDLLRLSHPFGIHPEVGNFILGKESTAVAPSLINGFVVMQKASSVTDVLRALEAWPNLPWETIPTEFLKDARVWKALFDNGQLRGQALVRNIKRLLAIGAFADQTFLKAFNDQLRDPEMIKKSRLHPMHYMLALRVNPSFPMGMEDALEDGLDLSFGNHVPAGKNTLLAVDVSGSMSWGMTAGAPVSPAEAAAMMAMITVRTERFTQTMAFATQFRELAITKRTSLKDVLAKTRSMNFGGTDCALPMTWAQQHKLDIDTFVVLTDNETWAGSVHPFRALQDYRSARGIPAKLVVQAFSPTEFTIADPTDPGMLDVVGMDASTPSAIADFSAGRI